jgi:hypothetical protein
MKRRWGLCLRPCRDCYGVGGTGGKSRVARHVRAASPVYLSSRLS